MYISIDNIKINYIEKGQGDVVLLLHGWGSNIKLFDNLIDIISEKYRVFAFDMPGFGLSEEPKTSWNTDEYADFVIKFLKQFNLKRVIVLGHSHGGRVLIKLSARRNLPFEIDKIILVDSAGVVPKKTLKQKVKLKVFKCSKKVLEIKPIKQLFPNALENLRKKNGSADYNSATPIMRGSLVKVVNEDVTHLLKDIKQSTLLIWGENDTATPLSDGKLMESLLPDAGLVTLKNAGHYSFLDQQFIFNKVIKSFLKIGD